MAKIRTQEPRITPFSKRFSRALADLESKGVPQGAVAARLNCSENTITSWKLGHHQPRLKSLEAIAEALRIPLEEFLTERSSVGPEKNRSAEKLVDDLGRLDLLGPLEALVKQERSFRQLAQSSDDLIDLLKAAQRHAES